MYELLDYYTSKKVTYNTFLTSGEASRFKNIHLKKLSKGTELFNNLITIHLINKTKQNENNS